MTKLMTYAAVILLAVAASLGLGDGKANSRVNAVGALASDGAFRDGLYLGRLASESGHAIHPAIGRWAAEQDRANFALGYSRGYEQANGAVAQR